ncbi:MAG: DUF2512 family protein [Eubacteriales bacterium]|nr:YndM family protein [Bacillota bacterium]MBV1727488.1 YndM family protein [Desulforudis sp.]MDP3051537.1 DUF2512 family protein [Eubacteriales bacterium]MDQ7788995.1 DUF2512 family protein [Clostridia bacterium]MBV1735124.1 YndM family protein [Desulforudis sp.]
MDHARVLGVKFLYTAVIIFSVFAVFGDVSPANRLAAAVIVSGLTYTVGDLWVLPHFGSPVTAVVETLLAGLTIWAIELILLGFVVPVEAILISAAMLGVAELLFHRILGPEQLQGMEPPQP